MKSTNLPAISNPSAEMRAMRLTIGAVLQQKIAERFPSLPFRDACRWVSEEIGVAPAYLMRVIEADVGATLDLLSSLAARFDCAIAEFVTPPSPPVPSSVLQ